MKTLLISIAGLSILLGNSGCGSAEKNGERPAPKTMVAAAELVERLSHFHGRFSVSVQAAGENIKQRSGERAIKKRTLAWEMIVISHCREAVFQRDHLAALLDTWALCVQMRSFFETEDGRERLGEHTSVALQVSKELEADIERLAAAALPEASLLRARETVTTFAAAHPMQGTFVREPLRLLLDDPGKLGALS
jgi:hypothetical protein